MKMVVSRTPLRISFAGGGSDIPSHYQKYGGAVLSTTIDKFVYVMVKESFDGLFHLHYKETETCETVEQIQHPIIRETLKLFGMRKGLDISTLADVPKGTGLGSSSAFAVGLYHALAVFHGSNPNPAVLKAVAVKVEIELCGEPIGEQDQCAAAYGGFNLFQFGDHKVFQTPVIDNLNHEGKLLLLYTGKQREAKSVLGGETNADAISQMAAFALGSVLIMDRDASFDLGDLMHRCWGLKRLAFPKASNPDIDSKYDWAMKIGATGGKVLGAGGGGFLLFSAPQDKHAAIVKALGLRQLPFKFWPHGSQIISAT